MKVMCLEKKNNIEYFIGSFKESDEQSLVIETYTKNISKYAFAHSAVEKILFKECSPNIGESAFEVCKNLHTVIFGMLGEDGTVRESVLKNLNPNSVTGDYTIQLNAFKGCSKLTTLVLPEIKGTLAIEKDAFSSCEALRTVVALCDKIDFTGNPFADCPKHLTFICKEDSAVARFAREYGYGSAYVG